MRGLEILVICFASVVLLMARFALLRLHQPTSPALWVVKVFTSALSPILLLIGIIIAILGLLLHSIPIVVIAICSALLYLIHIIKISRASDVPNEFKQAFGMQWEDQIPRERKVSFLRGRYVLRLPGSPEPILSQNIPFYTVPGANRPILCDLWQPAKNIRQSGLAFIYLHGSAWTHLDKDFGTRIFFRHLASQGHVIMDVAYRLFPETDFMGMVHDAKHAIGWIKANAAAYGVNPERIVIGGGSAGAHIALLAAYTSGNKEFMPADLESADLTVHGVVSLYGQSDLTTTYYHTAQHLMGLKARPQKNKEGKGGMPSWIQKMAGKEFHRLGFDKEVEPGILAPILGGNPDEKPERYSLFSPITYVHADCPPTLILQGEQDILAPVQAIRELHLGLRKAGVLSIMHLLPQTDHAFDLILPRVSPSAHNAIYDVERFLAMRV